MTFYAAVTAAAIVFACGIVLGIAIGTVFAWRRQNRPTDAAYSPVATIERAWDHRQGGPVMVVRPESKPTR